MDWLEEHGHTDRLAFLQDEVLGEVFAPPAEAPWRALVSSPAIRNCVRACGGRWNQLEPTANDLIRHCASCNQPVVYCPAIQRPPTPFVADAAVTRAFDRPPAAPVPTWNPPAPRPIAVPTEEKLAPWRGALVRIRDWFTKK